MNILWLFNIITLFETFKVLKNYELKQIIFQLRCEISHPPTCRANKTISTTCDFCRTPMKQSNVTITFEYEAINAAAMNFKC